MVGGDDRLPKSRWAKIMEGEFEGADTGAVAAAFSAPVLGCGAEPGDQLSPELRQLAEELLRLIGPTAEAGAQTGGPKDAGRVVRGGPQGRPPKAQSTRDIVNRIRISFSALRAARVDTAFRQLLCAELISMVYNEGGSLVVPQGMRF